MKPFAFPRPSASLLLTLCALLIAGCNQADPGLEEKLTRSNAELEAARKELAAAREQIDALKKQIETARSTSAPGAPPAQAVNTASFKPLDRETLEESYVNAARTLQRKLESAIQGTYRIESFTLHPVEIASQVSTPYTSRLQVAFTRKADSAPIYIDIPVGADYSGQWNFPSIEEISAKLAAGGTPPQKSVTAAAPTTPSQGDFARQPQQPAMDSAIPNVIPGAQTVIFNWGDSGQPAQPPQSAPQPAFPPAAQSPPPALPDFVMPGPHTPSQGMPQAMPPVPPPQQSVPLTPQPPQQPAGDPVKVMPTDRDVIIQF